MAEGKKGRKIDRNRRTCERYRMRGMRERNKVTKINRHLRRFPADTCAQDALKRMRSTPRPMAAKREAVSV